jgi:hypothetical protein
MDLVLRLHLWLEKSLALAFTIQDTHDNTSMKLTLSVEKKGNLRPLKKAQVKIKFNPIKICHYLIQRKRKASLRTKRRALLRFCLRECPPIRT